MSGGSRVRRLPRGLISACLLASILSGPVFVLLLSVYVDGGGAIAARWPPVGAALGLPAGAVAMAPLDYLLMPLVTLPLTLPVALILVFPMTVVSALAVFGAFSGAKWPRRRITWLAAGMLIGVVASDRWLTIWSGPMAGAGDRWTAMAQGAIDGLLCAALAHRRLSRSGGFGTPPCR